MGTLKPQETTIILQYGDWYTGRWWVACYSVYIWYSDDGAGRVRIPPSPLLAAPNVTAHASAASALHIIRCGTIVTGAR